MHLHVEEVSFFNAKCIKPSRGSNVEVQRGGNVISKTIHVVTTLLPRGFVCRVHPRVLKDAVWWKVCGENSTQKCRGIWASWMPPKLHLRFFWNFTCKLEIYWKIVYFWSWPDVRFRSPCFGGPKCPKMTFFSKKFSKIFEKFFGDRLYISELLFAIPTKIDPF